MLEIQSKISLDTALKNVTARHPAYVIHKRGSRQTFIAAGKKILVYNPSQITYEKTDRKISRTIMSVVRSAATKYIRKHLGNIKEIKREYPVVCIDKQAWNQLPLNETFYLVDAKHCYWRVAYILGYISKNIYEKYVIEDKYKTLRNMSLAILTSPIRREYYYKKQKTHEINCLITDYETLYRNIRNFTYNHSGKVQQAIGNSFIGYRVDGIYTLPEGVTKTKNMFKNSGLNYKVTRCMKLDEKNYVNEDGEIKKMI